MSEAEARPTNFIRQIIDEDLASGKHTTVHTRFPPEPNGYLHIGHAKSICLNFGIAQDYKGQCNLRFDDTNPVKEDIEYVESIKNDVEWLGFHWSGNVRYSSDYFDQLHAYAIELINKGLAYVDELTPEQIREYRGTLTQPGKNSPYRDRSVEENLALFEKMRAGGFEEGKACLRAKIEMASLESCIREDLNENAPRAMAVIDPVKLVIENYQGEGEMVTMPNHPNKPEMGSRQVPFSGEIWIDRADFREEANKQYKRLVLGKEVRLRNAYVIKAERVEKDAEGNITTIFCTYDADTLSKDPADGRKVKGVIHWVSSAHALPVEIRLYDRLFSVPNPGAADDFLSVINPESLVIKQGFAEPSLKDAVAGKAFQFEREGYFCLDSRHSTAEKPVFNRTVGLRDTWAKVGE